MNVDLKLIRNSVSTTFSQVNVSTTEAHVLRSMCPQTPHVNNEDSAIPVAVRFFRAGNLCSKGAQEGLDSRRY